MSLHHILFAPEFPNAGCGVNDTVVELLITGMEQLEIPETTADIATLLAIEGIVTAIIEEVPNYQ
jgi:hypothetical protein